MNYRKQISELETKLMYQIGWLRVLNIQAKATAGKLSDRQYLEWLEEINKGGKL